jgi:poly-gamma-glutamate capsule biosynthesis protein CapA/YwtB (metallophosphatase superfamily)
MGQATPAAVFAVLLLAVSARAEEVHVAAVGDVMPGSAWPEPVLPPDDGAALFEELTPALASADIAFGNLEGPLLDEGEPDPCRPEEAPCFRFRVPVRYAARLKAAGFDVMSLANNHAFDFGEAGRRSTLPGEVARLRVKGARVAVVAFSAFGPAHDVNDLEETRRTVAALAAENDIVVASFHGGRGRPPCPAARAGRGRLIAYSLGNFATYGRFDLDGPMGVSLVLLARLAPDGEFLGGKLVPARQAGAGGPRLDPKRRALRLVRRLSKKDFGRTAVRVANDGTLKPPR